MGGLLLARVEKVPQGDIAGPFDRLCQGAVRVGLLFTALQQLIDAAVLNPQGFKLRRYPAYFFETGVLVRFGKDNIKPHGLRAVFAESIHQLGDYRPFPRPSSQFAQALLVDGGDHRLAAGRLGAPGDKPQVQSLQLHKLEKGNFYKIEHQRDQYHQNCNLQRGCGDEILQKLFHRRPSFPNCTKIVSKGASKSRQRKVMEDIHNTVILGFDCA